MLDGALSCGVRVCLLDRSWMETFLFEVKFDENFGLLLVRLALLGVVWF